MPNYRRWFVPGGTYFFTVNLVRRDSRLLIDHIDALRAAYAETGRRQPFETIAICVLPNHLHCIWTLPDGDSDFSGRWRRIKTGFTRRLPRTADPAPGRRPGERGVWQRRFWEHVITDADDLAEHIAYVHGNPVKHRLVTEMDEWPFSSWHRWKRQNAIETTGATVHFGDASMHPTTPPPPMYGALSQRRNAPAASDACYSFNAPYPRPNAIHVGCIEPKGEMHRRRRMRVTCYPLWRNAPPGTDACYLLKPDKKTGLCSLSSATDELTDETYATIADLETLLIQLIGPKNNTNENRFRHAKRWDQIAEYETDYWLQRIKPE